MKGLIVTPEEASALHDGTQTIISRPMKVQPPDDRYQLVTQLDSSTTDGSKDNGKCSWAVVNGLEIKNQGLYFKCPYAVGDEIYIKETWYTLRGCFEEEYGGHQFGEATFGGGGWQELSVEDGWKWVDGKLITDKELTAYAADGDPTMRAGEDWDDIFGWGEKHPSTHMKQDTARTFLRIKSVKAMQVQDISEKEARAEGVLPEWDGHQMWYANHSKGAKSNFNGYSGWRKSYQSLWDARYAKKGLGWDVNPWIFSWEVEKINP